MMDSIGRRSGERKRRGEVSQIDESCRKRPYVKPRLVDYGDLRTLTLGGSPGMGDSGGTMMVRKPL